MNNDINSLNRPGEDLTYKKMDDLCKQLLSTTDKKTQETHHIVFKKNDPLNSLGVESKPTVWQAIKIFIGKLIPRYYVSRDISENEQIAKKLLEHVLAHRKKEERDTLLSFIPEKTQNHIESDTKKTLSKLSNSSNLIILNLLKLDDSAPISECSSGKDVVYTEINKLLVEAKTLPEYSWVMYKKAFDTGHEGLKATWLMCAAEAGNPNACLDLAKMYIHGFHKTILRGKQLEVSKSISFSPQEVKKYVELYRTLVPDPKPTLAELLKSLADEARDTSSSRKQSTTQRDITTFSINALYGESSPERHPETSIHINEDIDTDFATLIQVQNERAMYSRLEALTNNNKDTLLPYLLENMKNLPQRNQKPEVFVYLCSFFDFSSKTVVTDLCSWAEKFGFDVPQSIQEALKTCSPAELKELFPTPLFPRGVYIFSTPFMSIFLNRPLRPSLGAKILDISSQVPPIILKNILLENSKKDSLLNEDRVALLEKIIAPEQQPGPPSPSVTTEEQSKSVSLKMRCEKHLENITQTLNQPQGDLIDAFTKARDNCSFLKKIFTYDIYDTAITGFKKALDDLKEDPLRAFSSLLGCKNVEELEASVGKGDARAFTVLFQWYKGNSLDELYKRFGGVLKSPYFSPNKKVDENKAREILEQAKKAHIPEAMRIYAVQVEQSSDQKESLLKEATERGDCKALFHYIKTQIEKSIPSETTIKDFIKNNPNKVEELRLLLSSTKDTKDPLYLALYREIPFDTQFDAENPLKMFSLLLGYKTLDELETAAKTKDEKAFNVIAHWHEGKSLDDLYRLYGGKALDQEENWKKTQVVGLVLQKVKTERPTFSTNTNPDPSKVREFLTIAKDANVPWAMRKFALEESILDNEKKELFEKAATAGDGEALFRYIKLQLRKGADPTEFTKTCIQNNQQHLQELQEIASPRQNDSEAAKKARELLNGLLLKPKKD